MRSVELVIFPALTINFALVRKHLARSATPLTAQDTSKLTENERNTLVDAPHKAVEKARMVSDTLGQMTC